MPRSSGPRILLLITERAKWGLGTRDYVAQFGFDEGLRANGAEVLTLTPQWFSRAKEIIGGRKFDQIWLETIWTQYDRSWLEWIMELAPVRISWLGETLRYSEEERQAGKLPGGAQLLGRLDELDYRLRMLTHLLPVDDADVPYLEQRYGLPSMWAPAMTMDRFICDHPGPPKMDCATFMGSAYEERARLLNDPALQGLLIHRQSTEEGTLLPAFFFASYLLMRVGQRTGIPGHGFTLSTYLARQRWVRRTIFHKWLAGMREGIAVVNLQSRLKGYPGRVVEGMTAGRPVISWAVPDRPRVQAQFEEGKEILLYRDSAGEIAEHIRRLRKDPQWAAGIVANARQKVRRLHTMEQRIRQVWHWLETGEAPTYA